MVLYGNSSLSKVCLACKKPECLGSTFASKISNSAVYKDKNIDKQTLQKQYGNLTRWVDKLAEYELDGKVYFTHLGQSRFRPFDTDLLTQYWVNRIDEYLK